MCDPREEGGSYATRWGYLLGDSINVARASPGRDNTTKVGGGMHCTVGMLSSFFTASVVKFVTFCCFVIVRGFGCSAQRAAP